MHLRCTPTSLKLSTKRSIFGFFFSLCAIREPFLKRRNCVVVEQGLLSSLLLRMWWYDRRRHILIKMKFSINYTSFPHFIFLTRKNEANFFFFHLRKKKFCAVVQLFWNIHNFFPSFSSPPFQMYKSTPNDINRMTFLVFFCCLNSRLLLLPLPYRFYPFFPFFRSLDFFHFKSINVNGVQ